MQSSELSEFENNQNYILKNNVNTPLSYFLSTNKNSLS